MQSRATHVAIIAGMSAIGIALVAIMASWLIDSGVGNALTVGAPAFPDTSSTQLAFGENAPANALEADSPLRPRQ